MPCDDTESGRTRKNHSTKLKKFPCPERVVDCSGRRSCGDKSLA